MVLLLQKVINKVKGWYRGGSFEPHDVQGMGPADSSELEENIYEYVPEHLLLTELKIHCFLGVTLGQQATVQDIWEHRSPNARFKNLLNQAISI